MIPFTQYMLPNGAKKEVGFQVDNEIQLLADDLLKAGCHFDVEVLRTGLVSMTCENEGELFEDNPVLSIKISRNDPQDLTRNVVLLVKNAHAYLKEKQND